MTPCRLHELLQGQELTEREVQVLFGASHGETSKQTADAIGLADETVKHYRKTLCAKLGAKNLAHAVSRGFDDGYLTLEEPTWPN